MGRPVCRAVNAQQTRAIEEIREGISQVSSVVRQNAATAEEMLAQATTLRGEVGRFQLDADTHALSPAPLPSGHGAAPAGKY